MLVKQKKKILINAIRPPPLNNQKGIRSEAEVFLHVSIRWLNQHPFAVTPKERGAGGEGLENESGALLEWKFVIGSHVLVFLHYSQN